MFLIRKKSPKSAHIWNNNDTVCRMYSTGGLNKKKYKVVKDTDVKLCKICEAVAKKNKISKIKKYSDLTMSYSRNLNAHVVWNGDGDALAAFYGGYIDAVTYINGEEEARKFIKRRGQKNRKMNNNTDLRTTEDTQTNYESYLEAMDRDWVFETTGKGIGYGGSVKILAIT